MVVGDLTEVDAFVVHATLQRDSRSFRLRGTVAVSRKDVAHRAAVGNNIALEPPCTAKQSLKQELVGTGRLSIDAVVRTHHRSGVTFDNGGTKRRRIRIQLIMLCYIHVGEVTCGLGSAVHGEVLRRRDRAVILRIVALYSGHVRNRKASAQKGIFSVGFLTAAPARITENVNVRRPEIEALENIGVPCPLGLHMLDAAFNADRSRHLVDARNVKRCGKPDRLGKFGGAVHSDPVKGLAPPVIRGYTEPWDSASLIYELRRFLLQRHTVNQVSSTLLRRKDGIHVRQFGSVLRNGGASYEGEVDTEYNWDEFSAILHLVSVECIDMPLSATCLKAEILTEKLHDMILETIGYLAGMSSRIHFKAVHDSVLFQNFVQLAGVDP